MKPKEAKFSQRFKTGEYEFAEYSVTVDLEEGESIIEALQSLSSDVGLAHSGDAPPTKVKKARKKPKQEEENDESASDDESAENSDSDSESESDEGSEDGDATDADSSDDGDDSSGESEDGDDDGEADEGSPRSKKTKSGKGKAEGKGSKKVFKKKPQKYARSLEAHKEIFSSILKEVSPKWKSTDASKALAKSVSQKMEGKDFLDENGEVVSEFKAAVKKLMAAKK